MMKYFWIYPIAFLVLSSCASAPSQSRGTSSSASSVTSPNCPYPGTPLNWVLQYCSVAEESDDEIKLQQSECFQDAESDLKDLDLKNPTAVCEMNQKYKTRTCELWMNDEYTHHDSVEECVADPDIEAFEAGS